MTDYSQLSALRNVARACKAEMEGESDLEKRREILERHLNPLKIKFGMKKVELRVEIYKLTKGM